MAKNQKSYFTQCKNYIYEHPYQTVGLVVGTGLVAYSLPVMIAYSSAYYAATSSVSKQLAILGAGSLAEAQSELAATITLNDGFVAEIMNLGELSMIDTVACVELNEVALDYVKINIPNAVTFDFNDRELLVSTVVVASQEVWAPLIETLGNNIAAYSVATVGLAAVTFPIAAAVAGGAGVVILTAVTLDKLGVIDVEGWMPHYS